MTPEDRAIGQNIRRLREDTGWPQSKLATRMNRWGFKWRQSTVARVESGERALTFREAWALVTLLVVSFDELCWIEDTVDA